MLVIRHQFAVHQQCLLQGLIVNAVSELLALQIDLNDSRQMGFAYGTVELGAYAAIRELAAAMALAGVLLIELSHPIAWLAAPVWQSFRARAAV